MHTGRGDCSPHKITAKIKTTFCVPLSAVLAPRRTRQSVSPATHHSAQAPLLRFLCEDGAFPALFPPRPSLSCARLALRFERSCLEEARRRRGSRGIASLGEALFALYWDAHAREVRRLLLTLGWSLSASPNELHCIGGCISASCDQVVQCLLSADAKVDAALSGGTTGLNLASAKGRVAMASLSSLGSADVRGDADSLDAAARNYDGPTS